MERSGRVNSWQIREAQCKASIDGQALKDSRGGGWELQCPSMALS